MIRLISIYGVLHLLLSVNISAQVIIPNSGFELYNALLPTKTANWLPENNDFFCAVDNSTSYQGVYSLKVSSNTNGHHFFNEEFPFRTEGLKKYKVGCAFKTKNLKGKVQLGARVFDKDGGTITKTAFTLSEKADQEWTIAEGIFVSDESAAKLRIFGNVWGTGEAWFDEISIVEVPTSVKEPSPEVTAYIKEYFDNVYEHSIINDKNIIKELERKTRYLCGDDISLNECRNILQKYTTPMLKDGHSFFATKEEWKAMMEEGRHPVTLQTHHDMPTGKMLKEKIAYINIPTFISSDEKLMQQYAETLQKLIASFDTKDTKGYIIDLSENGGGNSLPMIAGVGPLVGNGINSYSFSGNGSVKARIYKNGSVGWDTSFSFHKPDPYQLKHTGRPIAVIYSNKTGSSGEVTAMAFIGLPNTKSFGQPTSGATTRIDNFEMSDGAYLNLASGIAADRNKNKYPGSIAPDKETPDAASAISEAEKWISGK